MVDQPTARESSESLAREAQVPPTVHDAECAADPSSTDPPTCSLDATSGAASPSSSKRRPGALAPGQQVDDFEIISILGTGAFATVYLARQVSLDRQVALKVSVNRGTEARTLAHLEHEHIVRVFSETVDGPRDQRLLCMQYVNGITLERVIRALARRDARTWSGRAILETIDALCTRPATFDPAALRDRELLWHADFGEAVSWLGARLAEALAHAHSQGVLHRDLKPANILLNRYGRPLLADFNIAFDPRPVQGSARALFGGTLGYMAPEHLDAFNPAVKAPAEAVDERSDIYSLGVVLFETLTGRLPFPEPPGSGPVGDSLRRLATVRRAGPPVLPAWTVHEGIDQVVRRCLQPLPADRYSSASELANVLDGCYQWHRMEKALPEGGLITRRLLRQPFALGLALMLVPHLLGSIVNISYNGLRIMGQLNDAQQVAFRQLVLGYNSVVYPICLVLIVVLIAPLRRWWRRLGAGETMTAAEVDGVRRQVLRLPMWAIVFSCAGWLPGGLVFPLGLYWLTGSCPAEVFGHFLLSFTISGLIALTYSVYAVEYVTLRVLYPRLWLDVPDPQRQARAELKPLARRLWMLQLMAGLIPLTGAVLMVGVGPEDFTSGYRGFRCLVTALIGLGMLGFGVAVGVSGRLAQTIAALSGKQ